ncbi:MAG: hypothetical protein M3R52_05865, partial [Acidobacteriota bacterium]|nr:hypothetical protein [Acidobacteriota bacterium]
MAPEEKGYKRNRIPISFSEAHDETNSGAPAEGSATPAESDAEWEVTIDPDSDVDATSPEQEVFDSGGAPPSPSPQADG